MNLPIIVSIPDIMVGFGGIQESIGASEIRRWLFQEEIESAHITVYSVYLFNKCQERDLGHFFGFFNPQGIACHQGIQPEEREHYIANTMKDASQKKLYFAPYYKDHHWMLAVIHPCNDMAYWLDPLDGPIPDDCKNMFEMAMKLWYAHQNKTRPRKNILWAKLKCPRQPNNTDCGYYVLRYMEELIFKGRGRISEKLVGDATVGNGYQQRHIDGVRERWLEFIMELEEF